MTRPNPPRRHPLSRTTACIATLLCAGVLALATATTAQGTAMAAVLADAGEGSVEFYVVEQGDGFYRIANKLEVDVEALLARNGLTIDHVLHPGYVLLVPQEGFVPPSTTAPPPTAPPAPEPTEAQQPTDAPQPQPPSAQPPTTQPPATQPPATQPPDNTPATTPPPTPAPTPAPTEPATTPPPPPPSGTGDCVVGGIGWINNARANEGLPGIGQGNAGNACAHSRNMAQAGSIYHGAGGCGWEIVGYTSGNHSDLPGAWLSSSSHYGVVTAPEITSGAVAYVQNLSTGYWYGTGTFC